jgi:hypothetical protein
MVASLCSRFVEEVWKNMTEFLVVIVTKVHVHQIKSVNMMVQDIIKNIFSYTLGMCEHRTVLYCITLSNKSVYGTRTATNGC